MGFAGRPLGLAASSRFLYATALARPAAVVRDAGNVFDEGNFEPGGLDSADRRFAAGSGSVDVDADAARTLLKLIDTLDDTDDVQRVSVNFEVSDDIMAELTG